MNEDLYEEVMLVCTVCLSANISGILYADINKADRWLCNQCGNNQAGLVSKKQWEDYREGRS